MRPIIAAQSTAAKGKISRIVPRFEGPVKGRCIDTHYIGRERPYTDGTSVLIFLSVKVRAADTGPAAALSTSPRLRRASSGSGVGARGPECGSISNTADRRRLIFTGGFSRD
jgi:hypothetical protein